MKAFVPHTFCAILSLTLVSCGSNGPVSGEGSEKLRFEVVSVEPTTTSSQKVRVTFKMTNKSDQKIIRVKATISVLDDAGTEIGSESHWVIRSEPRIRQEDGSVSGGGGGLDPGATTEENYLIDVSDKTKAAKAVFKLETVRGG